MAQFDFAAYRDRIADMVERHLAEPGGIAAVRAAMAQVQAWAEQTLAREISEQQRRELACGPGCAHCCRVTVTVLIPEALAIAAHLRDSFGPEGAERWRLTLGETARAVRWMDDADRVRADIPCPFLDEKNHCVIHPLRPLTCRALTSTDPARCRSALDALASGREEPLLTNLFQKFLMEMTFRGIADGLERRGLDTMGRELCRAVAHSLESPTLVNEFLAGRRTLFPE
ncbi:MAG: YkgJ family cysteine cluster protein [Desulfuromonadales bacterium]|nr:MAG: YkgJ family cysteine cluster protein [Desulfuromonadales bacterium]